MMWSVAQMIFEALLKVFFWKIILIASDVLKQIYNKHNLETDLLDFLFYLK